jgi:hypothetical protein
MGLRNKTQQPFWRTTPTRTTQATELYRHGMECVSRRDGKGMIATGWALCQVAALHENQANDFLTDGYRVWKESTEFDRAQATTFLVDLFGALCSLTPPPVPDDIWSAAPEAVLPASIYFGTRCWTGNELLEITTDPTVTAQYEPLVFRSSAEAPYDFVPTRSINFAKSYAAAHGLPEPWVIELPAPRDSVLVGSAAGPASANSTPSRAEYAPPASPPAPSQSDYAPPPPVNGSPPMTNYAPPASGPAPARDYAPPTAPTPSREEPRTQRPAPAPEPAAQPHPEGGAEQRTVTRPRPRPRPQAAARAGAPAANGAKPAAAPAEPAAQPVSRPAPTAESSPTIETPVRAPAHAAEPSPQAGAQTVAQPSPEPAVPPRLADLRRRVQEWLQGSYRDIRVEDNGWITIPDIGPSALHIETSLIEGNHLKIEVFTPLLLDVPPTADLFRFVAVEGARFHFGTMSLDAGDEGDEEDSGALLQFSHSLIADSLDRDTLFAVLWLVAATVIERSGELQQRFGGILYREMATS